MRWIALLLLSLSLPAFAFDHSGWNRLLESHVHWQRDGVASAVDYSGMRQEQAALDRYLASLSAVTPAQFENFSHDEKLAFLINAYNAFTVALILRQPALPDSIRDIGSFFNGPWDQRFFSLLGKKRTLDEVEHTLIRANPSLMDPRVHFALNCASVGCPALRPEAYQGERLDQQLTDNLKRFLSDRQRNRYNSRENRLEVSKIFDWYDDDFEKASGSVERYLLQYADTLALPETARQSLDSDSLDLHFLSYDWSLNREAHHDATPTDG
ncbi:hypothetical protein A11A3_00435 [Alcanivorax hongdengensis A-11-3]|uniref:DUF547 domain-containing protein n=1 Tax=Alcanivorax hongdengensis A-11-3 TaxID=1177179 RepID=L0WJC3_9GAMM|nr:DUF547 domain-containing protein [Alcanivorax hongdengensis]EKF75915.1 hypothetical protein A11A3_00435 [Alcanivorax hongdengensis A-11-3]